MDRMKFVIVGGGMAAGYAAKTLVELGAGLLLYAVVFGQKKATQLSVLEP
jgi:hypothetical protein